MTTGTFQDNRTNPFQDGNVLASTLYRGDSDQEAVGNISRSTISVLIVGESGTGKEVMAREIHRLSGRANKPFVTVSCNIPETLAESLLFGHERGSFTGAVGRQAGKFELAEGGTLFLDEVSKLSLYVQDRLLNVLQEKEFTPLGAPKARKTNVRIIAASNVDPQKAIAEGKLREDLYYRLNGWQVDVPPLRERQADIEPLVALFIQKYAQEERLQAVSVSPEAMSLLESYPWPGNVRELENAVHAALVISGGKTIEPAHLPRTLRLKKPISTGENKLVEAWAANTKLKDTLTRFFNAVGEGRNAGYHINLAMYKTALACRDDNMGAAGRLLDVVRETLSHDIGVCEEKTATAPLDPESSGLLDEIRNCFAGLLTQARENDGAKAALEKLVFESVAQCSAGDKAKATSILGFARKDVTYKYRQHGIERRAPEFEVCPS